MADDAPREGPTPNRQMSARGWLFWIATPAVAGVVAGLAATAIPWGNDLLGFVLVLSGLAWVLRVASDWFAERAGPQRGVAMLGSILFGTWLVLAVSGPGPLRQFGFGTLRPVRAEPDPYAIAPAGSRSPLPGLEQPSDPRDPMAPFRGLIEPNPDETKPSPPDVVLAAPAQVQRSPSRLDLRLSSATSVAGEGLVLIAEVHGDGRPVRGTIDFTVDDAIVASVPLRVQGEASQAEYRVVGLNSGLHTIRAFYRGSRSFEPVQSQMLQHRVAAQ
jgi:hypothetical protein